MQTLLRAQTGVSMSSLFQNVVTSYQITLKLNIYVYYCGSYPDFKQ